VQTDLPLFGHLRRNQFAEAVRQAGAMERLVRSHPCCVLNSFINEPFPPEWKRLEHRRLRRPELERFFIAAREAVLLENPDRVIKPVDGDYDPPTWGLPDNHCYTYWYLGHGIDAGKLDAGYWIPIKPGWHYGCGEFGAEGLDRLELMQRHCPKDWLPLGPDDPDWSPQAIPKAQAWKMGTLFFDPPRTAAEWVEKTRAHQALAVKRMTEAFRRDPRNVSCAVHLFIDAWPTGWMKTIVDVERVPKPAYYAFRDALNPLMVSWTLLRSRWISGESFAADVWICNDRPQSFEGLTLMWQLIHRGDVVHAESATLAVEACTSQSVGKVRLELPQVDERCGMILQYQLIDGERVVDSGEEAFEVFPELIAENPGIRFCGEVPAVRSLSLDEVSSAPIAICQDYAAFDQEREKWEQFVLDGGVLFLHRLPNGKYRFDGREVLIRENSMGNRHFVSRGTGHPLVEGFEAFDFNRWFDREAGYHTPLANQVVVAPDALTVLATTDHGWGESDTPEVAVVAEIPYGKGRFIVSQLHLEGRLPDHPIASRFWQRVAQAGSDFSRGGAETLRPAAINSWPAS
jgi:hypothetical protein